MQGVSQANLPDGEAWATSDYERIKIQAKTDMKAETAGKQFIRIVIEKE